MSTKLYNEQEMLETISDGPIGTGILAFRGLQQAISNHITKRKALDFGCGSGRSSRFLKQLGFDVTGVDISKRMIEEARKKNDDINYKLIEINSLSALAQQKFDLILLSFVLMEISSQAEIINTLKKLSPLLYPGGKLIIITASDFLYTSNWLSMYTNFPSNQNAKSGDIVKVFLKDYNIEINDYLWKEQDCEHCFIKSKLSVVDKFKPLGKPNDAKPWQDELISPPFVIYVLQPTK